MATVITMKDILKARDNMERDQHNPVQAGPVQEILPQKPEPTTTIRVTRSIRAKDSTTNYEIISNVKGLPISANPERQGSDSYSHRPKCEVLPATSRHFGRF